MHVLCLLYSVFTFDVCTLTFIFFIVFFILSMVEYRQCLTYTCILSGSVAIVHLMQMRPEGLSSLPSENKVVPVLSHCFSSAVSNRQNLPAL